MNCPKCNKVVEADSRFCRYCGQSMIASAAAASILATQPQAVAQTAAQATPPGSGPPEQQVWQGRPAWRSFFGSWLVWLLLSLILIWGAYQTEPQSAYRTVVWYAVLLSALVLFIRESIMILDLRYRLTTQRLFIHRGILSRVTDQMELIRVDDVRLRQGLIDRLVNTGDVEIIGSDETHASAVLESIDAPAEVAENIRRHVREARQNKTLFVESL